ncbi:rhomboid family intramembrane serine protease [Microbulbifer agarilyticus]|uniref:rhomboid family intramembrane serine protease n=1 Tax=Microbulbifer agarilyticus TaxID=260552 RepID=UPI001C961358|nr:rhomboid family intramembrane serine protease [Microbulbifer agarilyticus]MBY6211877.1 rhomboid family intramembrane serine protease [Microbulbifer agarilyticus]MCA0893098.1 rhomboid family intramembrane serine protease [Microbulbifer agarilyticus]
MTADSSSSLSLLSLLTPTTIVLVVTTAVSLAALYLSPRLLEECAFRPYRVWRGQNLDSIYLAGFVHANLLHLAVNMWCLWLFGSELAERIGGTLFVLLYALALIASHIPTLFKEHDNPQYASVGASGAISAVVFAYIVYYPQSELYLLFLPIPLPAWLFGVLYLVYSVYASRDKSSRINHDAHFWGAVTGLVFVLFTDPAAWARLL